MELLNNKGFGGVLILNLLSPSLRAVGMAIQDAELRSLWIATPTARNDEK
jgi:hypothetical protein